MSINIRMDKKDVVHTHTHVCVCIMEYYSVTEITKFAICSTWVDLGASLVT